MRGAGVAYERDLYDMRWHDLYIGVFIVNVAFNGTHNHCDALKTKLMHPLGLLENHGHYTYIYEKTMMHSSFDRFTQSIKPSI